MVNLPTSAIGTQTGILEHICRYEAGDEMAGVEGMDLAYNILQNKGFGLSSLNTSGTGFSGYL